MTLQEFAAEMAGKPLPPGPKVMSSLGDGLFAVKVQVEGVVGYVLVNAEGLCSGELLTLAEVARRRDPSAFRG